MQLTVFICVVFSNVYADIPQGETSEVWLRWFGNYHYIFVHFPIALIVMACIAELLCSWRKNPQYNFVVYFLLIAAAIFAIPTVFAGLSLEESGVVGAKDEFLIEWHEFFGLVTLSLIFITLLLRYFWGRRSIYFWSLIVLFICVLITAHLGGAVAFDDFKLLPPFFGQTT